MGFAGLLGKGCRNRQNLSAGDSFRAEERREADVVADGETKGRQRQFCNTCRLTRLIGGAFTPALAIVEIDIEHVDLVIGADAVSIRRKEKTTIGDLAVGTRNRRGADMNIDPEFTRKLGCGGNDDVAGLVFQDGLECGTVALQSAGHLRRLHIDGALRHSVAHQPLHSLGVSLRIRSGAHLDCGGLEAHVSLPNVHLK